MAVGSGGFVTLIANRYQLLEKLGEASEASS